MMTEDYSGTGQDNESTILTCQPNTAVRILQNRTPSQAKGEALLKQDRPNNTQRAGTAAQPYSLESPKRASSQTQDPGGHVLPRLASIP